MQKHKIQIKHFPGHLFVHIPIYFVFISMEKVVHYKQLKNLIPGQVLVQFLIL